VLCNTIPCRTHSVVANNKLITTTHVARACAASKSEALLRSTRGSLSAPTADVLAALDDCVDASGLIQDAASQALAAARAARIANATELRTVLETLAKKLYDEGGAERAQLVTRRGRQCLPVRRGQQGLLPSGGACGLPHQRRALIVPILSEPQRAMHWASSVEGDVLAGAMVMIVGAAEGSEGEPTKQPTKEHRGRPSLSGRT
jgi:hypothetical protein